MTVRKRGASARARAEPGAPADEILRHWREAVPNDRLAHLIKDATRGLVRALTARLALHKVSFGHWVFLRILWERDGMTQRELAAQAGLTEPTTLSALTAMERAGYVVRRKMPDNRKNVHVFLTPKGRALRAALVPLAEEVNRLAVAGIPVADVAVTRTTLLAMIENLAGEASERRKG
jgi:DNA-binding MarR family transcriptional regulator